MSSKTKLIFFLLLIISSLLFSQTDNKKEASKLFFYDNQFGVFVKGGNRVAVTNNGGQNWQEVFVDTDENLQKVLFQNKLEGWLIGDSTIYKSTDGGLTWVTNHTFTNIFRIYTLYFLDDKNGFIGSQSSEDTIKLILQMITDRTGLLQR